MNGTFRKGREYKFRQVPFKDITVTYTGANGNGLGATRFYFEYGTGVRVYLKRGKINPLFIETRRCLEGHNQRLNAAYKRYNHVG